MQNRLIVARKWLIIVLSYYLFRLFLVILPRFYLRSSFEQAMITVQMCAMLVIVLFTILSFFRQITIIKYLLYLQACQMCLSNYNLYQAENNANFEGLNMLSTVFSVIFCILNCYLASLVI